jgi:hypothetical protein
MSTQAIVPAEKSALQQVTEGSGAIERRHGHQTATEVLAAQAEAAVKARYVMALKRPRDWDVVRQRLLKECERTSFAQVARYSKPVGNTTVTGPSIRFVEAALRAMGNVLAENVVLYDDQQKRIIRVIVTDLEHNETYQKEILLEKTVERKQLRQGQVPISSRTNTRGERVYLVEATEDEMLNKEAALTSKAMRQLGLRLIPGDLVDECMEGVEATMRKKAEQDPDAEKKAIIDSFYELGVRVEHLKEYLGVDLDQLTPKDLVNLRAVYQALKDGETTWREVMDQREAILGKSAEAQVELATSKTAEVLAAIHSRQAAAGVPAAQAGRSAAGDTQGYTDRENGPQKAPEAQERPLDETASQQPEGVDGGLFPTAGPRKKGGNR